MKIVCTVKNLKDAVSITERFTGKHITLPILSYLSFKTKDKKILISATNLELGIEYLVPGKVERTGQVTIPARSLTQILQTLSDDTITIEVNQHRSTLHTLSTEVTLVGLNPEDFPTLPHIKKEQSFTIETSKLTSAFQQVVTAAATSDFKPELTGILMSVTSTHLTLTATDSFRLSEKILNQENKNQNKAEFIIPSRTIHEILRVGQSSLGTTIEITTGEHQVVFEWEEFRIISRLVDGAYPPYKNLIPKSFETTVVANRDDLLKKIRLASVFSSRLNDVTLRFTPQQLEVSTSNSDAGSTKARLAVKGRGSSGTVMFNYRYLTDGLEAAGGENTVVSLNGVSGPAMIQNPEDANFLYLIMPIRSA